MICFREKFMMEGVHNCPICGGSGKIEVFRNDWDEFDKIKCYNCATPLI